MTASAPERRKSRRAPVSPLALPLKGAGYLGKCPWKWAFRIGDGQLDSLAFGERFARNAFCPSFAPLWNGMGQTL